MIKALRMMLLATLAVFGSVVANAQETKTVKWQAADGAAFPNISVNDDVNMTSADAGYSTYGKNSQRVVSLAQGDKLTIAGADENVTLTKIVFTYLGDNLGLTPSVGRSSNSFADNTSTWTGEANSIEFKAGGRRYVQTIEITYTGAAVPVEKAPVLAITQDGIADTYDMDQNGVFVVYYANNGNAAAENAKLTLYVDGVENASKTIGKLDFGASTLNFWNAKYNLTNLAAGEHQVYLEMTADNAETVKTEAKTVTFTKKAPEAAFTITAGAVTVPYDAESYTVAALLQETNNVAAANVTVELRKGVADVLASAQVASIGGGAAVQVPLTVAKDLFETGQKTYYLYVNNKYLASVGVTFEAAPVQEVLDLAITEVLGTIKLAEENNYVRVTVQNNGNVDITDAAVVLKAGEKMLGEGTVSATAGNAGYVQVAVSKDGLEAGSLDVTATVAVEGDATPNDNTMTATLTVEAVPAPEAAFSVTAENVSVAYGAESFEIKAVVKNTSEVNAENVVVKLLKGATEVEVKTLETLAAGAEAEVVFTLTEIGEAGKTAAYYVQVANKAQAEVTVTFEAAPVEEVVDMAVEAIQGVSEINLSQENKIQVWYKNEGTKDLENVSVMLSVNDHAQEQTVNCAAGKNGYVEFTVPTDIFEPAEDVEAELVAWVNVEGDVNAANNKVTKTLPIVSGQAEPTAEIYLNPVASYEVEAGEQEVNVTVSVFNQSETIDAQDVKIELYKNYGDNLVEPQTVDVKAGGYKMLSFKFNYTFEAGKSYTFTVFTNYKDSNAEDNMRQFTLTCPAPKAEVSMAKIADIEATTDDEVTIAATLTNNSAVEAGEVKVGVYTVNSESHLFELVGIMKQVDIAAGESAEVEFNLGKLEAGTYTYYVRVTSVNGEAADVQRDLTVKVSAPVEPVVDMAITAIQGVSQIDLTKENVATVWYQNNSNVDLENVVIMFSVNDHSQEQAVSVKAGKSGYVTFAIDNSWFEPAEDTEAELVAWVKVEGDQNAGNDKLTKTVTVTNGEPAVATFEVVADKVTVAYGAERFEIKAVVKNTSEVNAENVVVKLFRNAEIATTTIESLEAGKSAEVTFAVEATDEAPFTFGKTETYYVMAPNAQAAVEVTFEAEPVEPVYDLAVTEVIGTVDLSVAESQIRVTVQNNGNQDIENAPVVLTTDEGIEMGKATVSAKAGQAGWCMIAVLTEGMEAGTQPVVATVTVENDATPDDNKLEAVLEVKGVAAPEATFSVVAEAVTVAYGAENFEIKAVVKNTSEYDADAVEVKLIQGGSTVQTYTIPALPATAEAEVVFQIAATDEAPFQFGKTVNYYVQVANKAQAEVEVTFEAEPVEPVVDMAITAIMGISEIDLTAENLTAQVWYENQGNVDLNNVVIMFSVNDNPQEQTVSVAAGKSGYVTFTIDPADFEAAEDVEAELIAWVNVEGDQNAENNKVTKVVPVVNGVAELTFEVAEVVATKGATSFDVTVTVKNSGLAAAENLVVKVYDEASVELGTATIEKIVAGGEVSTVISVEKTYDEVGLFKNELQVGVTGLESVWVDVNVIETAVGIAAVKAQLGENVQIFTLSGKKVESVRRGQVYIINGKKIAVK